MADSLAVVQRSGTFSRFPTFAVGLLGGVISPILYTAAIVALACLIAFVLSLVQSTKDSQVIYRCPACRHAERCQRTEREAWSFHCNQCQQTWSTWGQTPIAVH